MRVKVDKRSAMIMRERDIIAQQVVIKKVAIITVQTEKDLRTSTQIITGQDLLYTIIANYKYTWTKTVKGILLTKKLDY